MDSTSFTLNVYSVNECVKMEMESCSKDVDPSVDLKLVLERIVHYI